MFATRFMLRLTAVVTCASSALGQTAPPPVTIGVNYSTHAEWIGVGSAGSVGAPLDWLREVPTQNAFAHVTAALGQTPHIASQIHLASSAVTFFCAHINDQTLQCDVWQPRTPISMSGSVGGALNLGSTATHPPGTPLRLIASVTPPADRKGGYSLSVSRPADPNPINLIYMDELTGVTTAEATIYAGESITFNFFTIGYFCDSNDYTFRLAILGPPAGRGDLNCDGAVNNFDLDLFVEALLDPIGFTAAHPDCPADNADLNSDGYVNNIDIEDFVNCVLAGGCP